MAHDWTRHPWPWPLNKITHTQAHELWQIKRFIAKHDGARRSVSLNGLICEAITNYIHSMRHALKEDAA